MKIVISSGHGKYVRGASGYIDEVDEARKVVDRVTSILNSAGIQTAKFHDDTSHSQSENLNTIVNFHNRQERDLDISVHFNCYQTTSKPMGTEVLYVTQASLAGEVCDAICLAGNFTNRGPKKRTDLAFLNKTEEPAILLEVCFVDSSADVELYRTHFENVCYAIAESISGDTIPLPPPEQPVEPIPPDLTEPPEQPPYHPPETIPVEDRPVLKKEDEGTHVYDLQMMLPEFGGEVDGDFGPVTEEAVINYQRSRALGVDGIVGQETWGALYDNKPPPAPPPHALSEQEQVEIKKIANNSAIARYSWRDRGVAPKGYTQGMALAFAQTYRKLNADHPAAIRMAKARTNSDKDALNIYRSNFDSLGMSNETSGADTLRHLYALMLGHGMRESSGKHCEGRDQSASNVASDTAEAGLFQTSYNAHSASDPEFDALMDEYSSSANTATCYYSAFAENVSCGSSDWDCYGSGAGYRFQELCKNCPPFAVETAALTLRNLANHYGPIIRKETELREDANTMFKLVQDYLDSLEEERII